MSSRRYIPLALFVFVAAAIGQHLYSSNHGFGEWMPLPTLRTMLEADAQEPSVSKQVAGIEGRWREGRPEFRIKSTAPFANQASSPVFFYNLNEQEFHRQLELRLEAGERLLQFNRFAWPDGTLRYQGIWVMSGPNP
jgi:hypothetical protein